LNYSAKPDSLVKSNSLFGENVRIPLKFLITDASQKRCRRTASAKRR